jgi:lysophospholipase L1-like esterase
VLSGVAFYGDSLAVQAQDWLKLRVPTLYLHVRSGSALCDWLPSMRTDLAREHPRVVLLAFAGNGWTPCTRPQGKALAGSALVANYATAARAAISLARASGATVVLVRPPVASDQVQKLNMVGSKTVINGWTLQPGAWTLDGGKLVAPHQRFVWQVGDYRVRTPDGVHLTPYGAALYAQAIADGLDRITPLLRP